MRPPVLLLIFLAVASSVFAQSSDLSGKVAFVSLSTGKLVKDGEPLSEFAPKVLLRFTRKGSTSRFLAVTDTDGTAFIPIEAGTYCVEAFGVDGNRAKMSARSSEPIHRCLLPLLAGWWSLVSRSPPTQNTEARYRLSVLSSIVDVTSPLHSKHQTDGRSNEITGTAPELHR
jgi:hypothetical protein